MKINDSIQNLLHTVYPLKVMTAGNYGHRSHGIQISDYAQEPKVFAESWDGSSIKGTERRPWIVIVLSHLRILFCSSLSVGLVTVEKRCHSYSWATIYLKYSRELLLFSRRWYCYAKAGKLQLSNRVATESFCTCQCCLCVCGAGLWQWCEPSWGWRQSVDPGLGLSVRYPLLRSQWSVPPPREAPVLPIYTDATCTRDLKKKKNSTWETLVTPYNYYTIKY